MKMNADGGLEEMMDIEDEELDGDDADVEDADDADIEDEDDGWSAN